MPSFVLCRYLINSFTLVVNITLQIYCCQALSLNYGEGGCVAQNRNQADPPTEELAKHKNIFNLCLPSLPQWFSTKVLRVVRT